MTCRAALWNRYDGPIPPMAAVSPEIDQRAMAWRAVRRTGHALVQESRAMREFKSVVHLNNWKRLRRQLAWELETWKRWR